MIKLYSQAMAFIATYKNDERGVTAIEYGLIAVAMAGLLGAVLAGDSTMMDALKSSFSDITKSITDVNAGAIEKP